MIEPLESRTVLPSRSPVSGAVAEIPALTRLLSLATGVVVVATLYLGRAVLVPIMLAVLLSFVLAPLVSALRYLRLGKTPSAMLAVGVAVAVIGLTASVIGGQVASLADDVPTYVKQLERKAAGVRNSTIGHLPEAISKVARQFRHAAGLDPSTERRSVRSASAARPLPVEVYEPTPGSLEVARRLLAPIVKPLETTIIVLIVAIFILSQKEDLRNRIIRLAGSSDLHRTTIAMDDAAARLSRYFLTQLALNTLFGAVIGIGLYWLGVPSPWLWGILSGLLRFVPYIGAFLSAVPPLLLAAAVDPGWTLAIWTAALFLIAEPLMGYGVEPLVYGHSTGLAPVSVVVAAIFWAWLWGPIGLILSTPLTLGMVVLGRHVKRLEFLDVLLGDRPALSPIESFYQRMLAGDSDEVLEQAESLLKGQSLAAYYDDVAVPAMRLADADTARKVLTTKQLERVARAVATLIKDLDTLHDDSPVVAPPGWTEPGAILCIAGGGTLCGAIAAMTAQLLTKRHYGASVVGHHDLALQKIDSFDPAGARLALLCQLSAGAGQPGLSLTVRRLQDRLGPIPLIVGLWSEGEGSEIGVLETAGSLGQLLSAVADEVESSALARQVESALPARPTPV